MAVTSCPIPSVSKAAAIAPAQKIPIPYPGARTEFSDLVMEIQLDSQMDNYWAIYKNLCNDIVGDIVLTAYDANGKESDNILFQDAFVSSIGEVNRSSTDQSDEIQTVSVTFKYTLFKRL